MEESLLRQPMQRGFHVRVVQWSVHSTVEPPYDEIASDGDEWDVNRCSRFEADCAGRRGLASKT